MSQQYPSQPQYQPQQSPPPIPYEAAKPKQRGRNVALIAGVLAVIGSLVLIGLWSRGDFAANSARTATKFVVTGTITVEAGDRSEATDGGSCVTDGGYADVRVGAQVTIKDAGGVVIAVGALDVGHTSDVQSLPKFNSDTATIENVPQATQCVFGFSVADVPEDMSFYAIEVSHRGELRYQRDTLSKPLMLSLG
jgi:hypothetical protein